MTRDQLIALLHQIFSRRIACSLADVTRSVERFVLEPVTWCGAVVGVLMRDGPEVHIEVADIGRRRWASRRFIRGVFKPLIDQYGAVQTTVAEANTKALNFCRRLGFNEIGRENGIVKMICKVTPWD